MKKIYYLIAMAMMAFTFTSCEDVPEPFGQPINPNSGSSTTVDPAGSGTATDPYNVAAALDYVKGLGSDAESPIDVYISGIVTEVTEAFGTEYGNATFKIADVENGKSVFTFYRGLYLGNVKYSDASAPNVNVGDKVVICGKVIYYKGTTPETSQGKAYVVSINGTGGGETPAPGGSHGTAEAPLTVAQAIAAIDAESTIAEAFVKGKISQIDSYSDQYKSITYWISDDGTTTTQLQVYSGKGLNGADFTSKNDISVGQTVVVKGALKKYNTTYEFDKTSSIISIDGEGGGGDTPSGTPSGSGTMTDPYNVVAIAQEAAKLEVGATSENDIYFKGKICSIKYTFSAQYGTATFNVSDDGQTGGTEFTCYSVYTLGNQPWVDGNTQIAVGNEVIICGKITNYNGTLETASKKAYIYSLNGNTEDSGDTGGNTGGSGTIEGNTISVTMSSLGIENGTEMGTRTLSDGTQLIFDGGGNSNAPKYYTSGSAARMYPKNTLKITATKNISSIKITCSANNAEGQVTATNGTLNTAEMVITVSGVNNTTTTITNAHTGTGATSQLRIASIEITYAN